ncbi:PAS domain-containing protein [Kordiimonas sp. SCSIO 12610]|uniref:PAS domain-containing protein n=1 Tax=Kordiimonas sp. SCSIO 12610 TaxID=2829597 RepID=UPI002108BBDD|nr:PAS domain-containing protein [Kordiimonas sp. SCSIO 12610]UTW54449.1 PAS domain-containing protein [Kordiimonas sp. SCSIO 12610]
MTYTDGFEQFLDIWDQLPKEGKTQLPLRSSISPASFGELMANIGLAEFIAPQNLTFFYYGSKIETLSSMLLTGKNYYSLLSEEFYPAMAAFHKQIFGVPCGAYVEDLIQTSSGNKYLFRNLQYPLLDDNGIPKFMLVFANARKPADDKSMRMQKKLKASTIKTLNYIDLGSGAPSHYVEDFTFYSG